MAVVSDTVFSLLVLASGTFAVSTAVFGVAWIRARERAIRAEQRAPQRLEDGDGTMRVDRLEDTVDAIALDLERMEEGQRFISRLLVERPGREAKADAHAVRVPVPG